MNIRLQQINKIRLGVLYCQSTVSAHLKLCQKSDLTVKHKNIHEHSSAADEFQNGFLWV
jgi:hypothetical protein